jgi:autotransporter-associated beta strand protein
MRSKCLAVCLLAGSLISAKAAVIYRETFGIPPGAATDQLASTFDWARFDNNGQPLTAVAVNFSATGRPTDVSNVNAGANSDGAFGPYVNGIFYLGATPSPSVAMTTEYEVDPDLYVPGSIVFSWYEGNNTAPQQFRLLVRVGGAWYASTNVFTSAAVGLTAFGTSSEFKSLPYATNATAWRTVTFDGDYLVGGGAIGNTSQPLGLGAAPATGLSGKITGFGVYGESGGGTGNRRFDSFTIEATPLVVAAAKNLLWQAGISSDWDYATANWRTNATGTDTFTFSDGDNVRFDDSAGTGFVNLIPSLFPKSIVISNSTVEYIFNGGGGIAGSATLVKRGNGLLRLANGNNSFTGGVTIEGGAIALGDGGYLGTIGAGNITNNGLLYAFRTNVTTLANSISGTGEVDNLNVGTLILSGSNSYSGVTVIGRGTLILKGINSGGGAILAAENTTLSGNGTNTGLARIPDEVPGPTPTPATLSPGDGIGTLTLGGLTLGGAATNIFDIGSANTVGSGVNDLLVINGNLTINNSPLVLNVPDLPLTGVPYRLISYTGSRTGAFNTNIIINGINRYTPTISYNDTNKTVNLTFTPPASPSLIIYRETFGSAPSVTADSFATAYDWLRFDNNGQPINTVGTASGVYFSAASPPTNAFNINAGPNNDGTFTAYINGILYIAPTFNPSLAMTSEFTVNPANYVPGSIIFSWYEGNAAAVQSMRLAVRVDTNWYVTDATFTSGVTALTAFGAAAQLKTFTYSPVATNWWQISFDGDYIPGPTPGTGTTNLSTKGPMGFIAQPTSDLSGPITAFGLYTEPNGGAGNMRADTFTIEAAPIGTIAQPRIAATSLTAGAVVLSITNGPPTWTLRVLSSTNLATPLSGWTGIKSATFAANGTVTITNNFGTNATQRFYTIQSP